MAELLSEISRLSIAERIRLMQAILQTLETETETEFSDAQLAEFEKRSIEMSSGAVKAVSWETVKEKLTARYGIQY